MHTIKVDIDNSIFDKVMFFLNNISNDSIKIEEIVTAKSKQDRKDNIVDFFQKSPIVGELNLQRDSDIYDSRIKF